MTKDEILKLSTNIFSNLSSNSKFFVKSSLQNYFGDCKTTLKDDLEGFAYLYTCTTFELTLMKFDLLSEITEIQKSLYLGLILNTEKLINKCEIITNEQLNKILDELILDLPNRVDINLLTANLYK